VKIFVNFCQSQRKIGQAPQTPSPKKEITQKEIHDPTIKNYRCPARPRSLLGRL
jgi:hypothetical protein